MAHLFTTGSTRTRPIAAALALALVAGAALGQSDAGEPLLRGPDVDGTLDTSTLVSRGFDGEMERLREQPEIAALRLIELDARTDAAVQAKLEARAATIDRIVRDNRETLSVFFQARKAKDRDGAREPMMVMREALRPVLEQGTLADLVAAELPESERERYTGLVHEYYRTAAEERRAQAGERRRGAPPEMMGGPDGAGRGPGPRGGPDATDDMTGDWIDGPLGDLGREGPLGEPGEARRGGPPARAGDDARRDERPGGRRGRQHTIAMQSVMMEVQQSYVRLITEMKDRKDEFDGMLAELGLTPEQQGAIEGIIAQARAERSGDEVTRDERRAMMMRIAQELTPEQRRAFREQLRGRRGQP
jgi:hypothetical protein